MKFVVTLDTVNPAWLGVTIDPKTPGFRHQNHLHKGYRLTIGNSDTIDGLNEADKLKVERLKQGQCVVIDDGSPESNVAIAKIDAEVLADIERLKAMAKMERQNRHEASKNNRQWDEKPVGNVTLVVIGGLILAGIIAILSHYWPIWFHSQTP